jgi:hypothetical protein
MTVVCGHAVAPPQASWLLTVFYPDCGVAVDVVFLPLYGSNQVDLFHPVRLDTHTFGHLLNLLEFHLALLYILFLFNQTENRAPRHA